MPKFLEPSTHGFAFNETKIRVTLDGWEEKIVNFILKILLPVLKDKLRHIKYFKGSFEQKLIRIRQHPI